MHENLNTNPVV